MNGLGQFQRVEVTTNQIDPAFEFRSSGYTKVGVGFGSVWVAFEGAGLVQRLDIMPYACGHEVRWVGAADRGGRDLIETTANHTGMLAFHHPAMQSTLLSLAEAAGAEARRGTTLMNVAPGQLPRVTVRWRDREETVRARLVIGADGRNSTVRARSGFTIRHDPERIVIAGVLHEGMPMPEDTVQIIGKPEIGQSVVIVPIGQQRFRSYVMYRKRGARSHVSGSEHHADFVRACIETGTPQEWFDHTQVATF